MTWNKQQIRAQALRSAPEDYAAFQAIGLENACGLTVLDAGCFDGYNTILKFAPYKSVERVVGVDVCEPAIDEALAAAPDGRFSFACLDFEACSICTLRMLAQDASGSGFYDVVYFSHSLQHMADPAAALKRAYELLAPGGFVLVKTTDDEAKLSYPDPESVMQRLFGLYEDYVRPQVSWTSHTDRYLGKKCYALCKGAGFEEVLVRTFVADTSGKSLQERMELFERCSYFRKQIPADMPAELAREYASLFEEWMALFCQEDYYFCNTTFYVIARKKPAGDEPWHFRGRVFGKGAQGPDIFCESGEDVPVQAGGLTLRSMREDDLAQVMAIEYRCFPDPWSPLAYSLELGSNPRSHYLVALGEDGGIWGYLGIWGTADQSWIAHIATDPEHRRQGVARALVERGLQLVAGAGYRTMALEVRAGNTGARAFYEALGFEDVAIKVAYYDEPVEDGLVMVRYFDKGEPSGL